MTVKKQLMKLFAILTVLLVFPIGASAFIEFCFPISLTLLILILGWPQIILYELFHYQASKELLDVTFISLGLFTNITILFLLGSRLDLRKKIEGSLFKKYRLKLPIFFIILIIVLYGFSLIDPTCAK